MHYLEIQGLFKACKFKDLSRQAVKFKGFSILYEPCTHLLSSIPPYVCVCVYICVCVCVCVHACVYVCVLLSEGLAAEHVLWKLVK